VSDNRGTINDRKKNER